MCMRCQFASRNRVNVHRNSDRIIDLQLDLAIPSRQGQYRKVDACPLLRIS